MLKRRDERAGVGRREEVEEEELMLGREEVEEEKLVL